MDNLTHSLFALTLGNAGLRRAGRGATAALLIASNVPDIEIVTAFDGGRAAYLSAHRGPTHGPAGLLLAIATAALVWLACRVRDWRPAEDRARRRDSAARADDGEAPARFWPLVAVACIGVAGHIAMDFATSYGTRVLSPFSATWYGVDWMPIVDVFMLAVMLAALVATRLRPRARRGIAAIVLVAIAADYAFRAVVHSMAAAKAAELQAYAGPPAAAGAETPVFQYLGPGNPAALPAALPTLGSPFRWRVVAHARQGFFVTEVNLLQRDPDWRRAALTQAVWFPDDKGPYVERAAAASVARVFLAFSRFPSAEILTHVNGDVTVHWYDLRFAERRLPVGGDRRQHSSPFGAWVRLTPNGQVVGQGLGPG